MELRLAGQDVCQEHRFQSWRDDPSSLGSSQSMGDFDRQDVRCQQFVNLLLVIDSELAGLVRVVLAEHPFQSMRRHRAKKPPESVVWGIEAHPKYKRL